MSGTACFDNSSTASTGNCVSAKGWPALAPKRKFGQTPSSLNRNHGGRLSAVATPARTSLSTA